MLFVPWGTYALEQQVAVGEYLREHTGLQSHFLFLSGEDRRSVEYLRVKNFPYVAMREEVLSTGAKRGGTPEGVRSTQQPGKFKRVIRRFPGGKGLLELLSIGYQPLITALQTASTSKRLQAEKRWARRTLRSLRPYCAVVSQERWIAFLPILKAMREEGIPVMLLLAADSSPDGGAALRKDGNFLSAGLSPARRHRDDGPSAGRALINKLVAWWMPGQVYASRWGRMLYTAPATLVALKLCGMLPRSLWYQGTTFVNHIIISGKDEMALYEQANVDPRKLLRFGVPEMDTLYSKWQMRPQLRNELALHYGFDAHKPFIVFAPPPLWEHELQSEEVHWQSLRAILDALKPIYNQVLVSLHPKMAIEHYRWMENDYSARICHERLKEVLSAADVFVCSYSSTLRWAVALGIPAINVDLWDLRYTIFRGLQNYTTVTNIAGLGSALASASLQGVTKTPLNGDIICDGKAKERLINLIRSFADASATTSPGREMAAT